MLLGAVLIPLILLLLLLLVPIDLVGAAASGRRPEISIVWLFGLVKRKLFQEGESGEEMPGESPETPKTSHREPTIEKSPEDSEGRTGRKSHVWSAQEVLSLFQAEGLAKNLKRLLRGLVHAIRISYFRASLRVGLEDPADTGQAVGCLWSAVGYMQSLYPLQLEVEPSFCQEVLDGQVRAALRIWPILVVMPLLQFLLSMPALRASMIILKLMKDKKRKAVCS